MSGKSLGFESALWTILGEHGILLFEGAIEDILVCLGGGLALQDGTSEAEGNIASVYHGLLHPGLGYIKR
jgi:hypothetical protein